MLSGCIRRLNFISVNKMEMNKVACCQTKDMHPPNGKQLWINGNTDFNYAIFQFRRIFFILTL
jgi:hypothetical protein